MASIIIKDDELWRVREMLLDRLQVEEGYPCPDVKDCIIMRKLIKKINYGLKKAYGHDCNMQIMSEMKDVYF